MNDHFVDRERERAGLAAFLAEAGSGRSSLLLIAGEAGVGKSTLVRTVLEEIGARAAEGHANQDGASPYGPFATVLRRLRSDGLLMEGPLRSHLAALLPELGPPVMESDRATVFEAVRSTLAAASAATEVPLTVFIDDMQWADHATLELLPSLARSLAGERVAILAAYRSDDMPRAHPIRKMRTELRRAGRLREIVVEPFDAQSTTALLAETLKTTPSAALSAAVFDRTDGVPFFVEELGSALAVGGRLRAGPRGLELMEGNDLPLPDSVRDAVLLRAADLSEEGRSAAMAAAVAGQEFSPSLVTDVAGLDQWPDELIRHGLVIDGDQGQMAFRHALIRDAFYGEVPWTRRVELHAATAERLEATGAPAVVVADHWVKARDPERARRCFVTAAEGFARVHAYRDGARAARRALDLWPDATGAVRSELLEHLAACAELAGDLGDAIAAWREAAYERRSGEDQRRLAEVRRRLASALELQGRWDEALAWREEAASAFDASGAPADAASERLSAAAHLRSAARFRGALGLLQRALPDARDAGRLDLEVRILGLEGNVRARMGEGADGVRLVRAALAAALDNGLTGPAAEIYQRLADSLEHAGDYPSARDTYGAAYGFCEANTLEPSAQLCHACLTVVLKQLGDWDRAAALCRTVIASPDANAHARAVATGTLGSILGVRGQTRVARPLLVESASLARAIELAAMELLSEWGLALVDEVEGATDRAAERCAAILDRWNLTEERHYAIGALRWVATFLAERGDIDATRECVASLGRIATDSPQDEALSAFSHGLGETALLDGLFEQAETQFVRAVELLQGVGAPFERIHSERRFAHTLLLTGRQGEAVEHLVTAHRLARRLKAGPLVGTLAAEVAALGERADRRTRRGSGPDVTNVLTRRETEIIRLVGVGRTNKEIAHELFLSPRTVDMHVQNILTKLDCRSRADATRRASELGLLDHRSRTPVVPGAYRRSDPQPGTA